MAIGNRVCWGARFTYLHQFARCLYSSGTCVLFTASVMSLTNESITIYEVPPLTFWCVMAISKRYPASNRRSWIKEMPMKLIKELFSENSKCTIWAYIQAKKLAYKWVRTRTVYPFLPTAPHIGSTKICDKCGFNRIASVTRTGCWAFERETCTIHRYCASCCKYMQHTCGAQVASHNEQLQEVYSRALLGKRKLCTMSK